MQSLINQIDQLNIGYFDTKSILQARKYVVCTADHEKYFSFNKFLSVDQSINVFSTYLIEFILENRTGR